MKAIRTASCSFPAMVFTLICLLAVSAAVFPLPARAQEAAVTLQDKERGTSVALYADSGGPDGYLLYVNHKYSYYAYIPPEITTVLILPDNGDGLLLSAKDGKAKLRLSGGSAEFMPGGLKGSFDQAFQAAGPEVNWILYAKDDVKEFWELSWKADNAMHKHKVIIRNGNMFDCEFSYPLSEEGKYGDMADTILDTFSREDSDGE